MTVYTTDWQIGSDVQWMGDGYHITAKTENKDSGQVAWTLNDNNSPHRFITVFENEQGRFPEYRGE